jgi:hypothetical protein
VCITKWHEKVVFMGSQGHFLDWPRHFCGNVWLASTTWLTDHDLWPNQLSEVGSSLPPLGDCSQQALVDLAPKWGRPTKVGPTGHLLGPLGQGLVLRSLPGQWTPMVTLALINFPFRSLEPSKLHPSSSNQINTKVVEHG